MLTIRGDPPVKSSNPVAPGITDAIYQQVFVKGPVSFSISSEKTKALLLDDDRLTSSDPNANENVTKKHLGERAKSVEIPNMWDSHWSPWAPQPRDGG